GRLTKNNLNITFRCDDRGLTEMILVNQFKVQMKKTDSALNGTRPLHFDILVEHYDNKNEIAYKVLYKRAKIQALNLPAMIQTPDDAPIEITASVFYETTEYQSAIGDILITL